MNALQILTAVAMGAFVSSCADSVGKGPSESHVAAPGWKLVYRHDAEGKPVDGSRADLLVAIRSGLPVRVAWGMKAERDGRMISVEHSAEPAFLTIVNEAEVVIQLPEHIAQHSYVDAVSPGFDDPAVMWRGLMSTNGTFDAVWVHRATGEEIRRSPQRVGLAWFAFQSEGPGAQEAIELAVPGGVRRAQETLQ